MRKEQILSERQRPRKIMQEINNLFAKYSIDGTGSDFTTPGAGTLSAYAVGKQIGKLGIISRPGRLCYCEVSSQ